MSEPVFTNNIAGHRYEARLDGEVAAFAEYNLLAGAIMFTHTEVLPAHEGKGLGSAIARHVLDEARGRQLNVIPVCQFIAGYIRKHREYVDLVQPHVRTAFQI
ncbi:GNAT family N-acetyltransferase [Pseudorhodoferax sp. Leaf267]|uniref:GNAT family N-acetyltransferase n=1 Tax=Pseudorhodoferax sp. Leaf267 TaxID=1736316 RepID=UPI0006F410DB|nr:GNAT family N-acetyltransferase [Pseudorhodoferax sp. Leaf267]KQP12262.1 acetyltransferase [Pseudorhodoferax sp. Leaf267]